MSKNRFASEADDKKMRKLDRSKNKHDQQASNGAHTNGTTGGSSNAFSDCTCVLNETKWK
jgi:hypothetical protein